MAEEKYNCKNCGKTISVYDSNVPTCCGEPMKKVDLDVCLQPAHPEHARPMRDDEPCDDGRSG